MIDSNNNYRAVAYRHHNHEHSHPRPPWPRVMRHCNVHDCMLRAGASNLLTITRKWLMECISWRMFAQLTCKIAIIWIHSLVQILLGSICIALYSRQMQQWFAPFIAIRLARIRIGGRVGVFGGYKKTTQTNQLLVRREIVWSKRYAPCWVDVICISNANCWRSDIGVVLVWRVILSEPPVSFLRDVDGIFRAFCWRIMKICDSKQNNTISFDWFRFAAHNTTKNTRQNVNVALQLILFVFDNSFTSSFFFFIASADLDAYIYH